MAWQDRADALKQSVPDPVRPLRFAARPVCGKVARWNSAQARRAAILGTTRQLVCEQGLDNVQITAVADRSGVSVQTVYNTIGSRREMLVAAASEWIVALAESADELAAKRDHNVVFTIVELFWAGAVTRRAYSENLIRAQTQSTMFEQPFVDITSQVIEQRLSRLASGNALVRWADTPSLAYHLAVGCHSSVRTWLNAPYDEGRFRKQLVTGCGLLLRGAMVGDEVGRLERALDLG